MMTKTAKNKFTLLVTVTSVLTLIPWAAAFAKNNVSTSSPSIKAGPEPSLPGLIGSPKLTSELRAAITQHGRGYTARTHHLDAQGKPKYVNRLIRETSPYLLQHAHNPVNWYPWGSDAFERARTLDRPVFLSVGYSTCHWCHVMERESFEDVEIAQFINQNFIPIKVDREERPDVDDIYMSAVHILHGRGGWPMTVMMTAQKEPFFGGTYFPARDGDRGRGKGFLSILKELATQYRSERATIVAKARQTSSRIRRQAQPRRRGSLPNADTLLKAAESFARRYDRRWGGFSRRPKFPRPVTLDFLLRYHRRTIDPFALKMVSHTLDRMASGGMYDQLGGGFHRYSVDQRWLVPHFEKMLYDNAQLTTTYVDAWQITKNPDFARIARETLDYISREMTAPTGAFYSATDADSPTPSGHAEEGWFFTWTPAEINALVGDTGLGFLRVVYGVTERGNFEGRNIFFRPRPLRESARRLQEPLPVVHARLSRLKRVLYEHRLQRPPPILDDKVLTSWNGLMISAFARAGRILNDKTYRHVAVRAARFLIKHLQGAGGRLKRTWRNGRSKLNAYLDDYAFTIRGLLDLFEATGQILWLKKAVELQTIQDAHYGDPRGGYFTTSTDHEVLIARDKPSYDGAEPSGNSVAAMNLLRLHALTSDEQYRKKADGVFKAFSQNLKYRGTSQPALLSALDMRLDMPLQIVILGAKDARSSLENVIRNTYLPNKALIITTPRRAKELSKMVPLLKGKASNDGHSTAYVCEEGRCERPTHDPNVLLEQITRFRPLLEDRSPPPLDSQR